ncbi:hypothetical protein K1720_07600 [Thermococcus argininiproducens]|uniref:Uncharacterized protein n=1 Tax=Thermococcus argininiproducens TaxID=2866384 RepID=A0A9E7M9G5_9EURY|nr:hypothetical protein [Thermococcus argininiproducens]USG99389.1 hypothetical protein K1720_07600 [Thermococcus argininiproducens]
MELKKAYLFSMIFLIISSQLVIAEEQVFDILDYFPSKPGYYIKYKTSDYYSRLDGIIELVAQHKVAESPTFTLYQSSGKGYFRNSFLMYKIEGNIVRFRGGTIGNQAHFWGSFFYVPRYITDGSTWSRRSGDFGNMVYKVEALGTIKIGDVTCVECIKISITTSNTLPEIADYFEGVETMYLSKGVGIVKVTFKRKNGRVFTAEMIENGYYSPSKITGKITLDGKVPAWGYGVAPTPIDIWAFVDYKGEFSMEIYGDWIVLFFGQAKNGNIELKIANNDIANMIEVSKPFTNLYLSMFMNPNDRNVKAVGRIVEKIDNWRNLGYNEGYGVIFVKISEIIMTT